jgi:23S rRNA pseudouridine1911/1915/1917 synthase
MKDTLPHQSFVVEDTIEKPLRVDKFLSLKYPEQSRSYFQKLIEDDQVLINGQKVKKRILPQKGDIVEVNFSLNREITIEPEEIPLDIIYEDDYLLAINKPPGLVVHPAPGNWSKTFVNGLLFYLNRQSDHNDVRPGIVHRLDKNTSGVLLAAKDDLTQRKLVELFANREMEKVYYAVTHGNPGACVVDQPIARHSHRRQEMAITSGETGRKAVTICTTIHYNESYSIAMLKPKTGRTHQLRVHLRHLNSPVVGDTVYGPKRTKHNVERQLLHAYSLTFIHPITGKSLTITAPLHEDLKAFINKELIAPGWDLLK